MARLVFITLERSSTSAAKVAATMNTTHAAIGVQAAQRDAECRGMYLPWIEN